MKEQARKPWSIRLICLALGLVTFALYSPSIRHEFVDYDDQQYITENPHVQAGLSGQGVVWAFGYHAGNWHPLAWLSHMLDCQFFGLSPVSHHLTNVLLHAANTGLLFLLLCRLSGSSGRSAMVAALFACHPLHVESVAWVAERKDVLCAFFFLLTLQAYARFAAESKVQSPKSKVWYGCSLFLFALALMSKPMAVTLPCVLLLLDFWPLRRFELSTLPRLLLGKIPFFILSAGVCWLTMAAQKTAIVSTAGLPLPQRIAHVLLAYVHYVVAMFFPINLSAYYPYETSIPSAHATFAFILLAVVSGLVFAFRRSRPYLAFGWLWFLGTLVPVVGLVQVGEQAWADRYTYLPLIGLFIAVVWGAAELVKNKFILRVVATAALVILSATTCVQLKYWRNTRALFEHASQVTPNNYMAVTLLGSLLAKEGKFNEAIEYYRRALSYKPSYPEAHFFLGHALDQQGKLDEAIAEYRKSLGFKPALEQTHIFLGLALAKQKQDSEAESHYLAALKINPESAGAHNALARLLHAQGRFSDAFAHYQAALKSDPNLAPAHNNLGILLLQEGRPKEGALELREAMKLNPSNPETEYNLALALNQLAQWQEASELFSKTVGRSSTDANAHSQFAVALAHANKTREAMAQYASALLLQPDFPDALDGLAWILSTDPSPAVRNGIEAVRMAERACELTGRKDAEKLKTLAAAYAEAGRFPEAIAATQSAFDLASRTRQTALAEECEQMSSSYKLAKPWRADR